MLLVAVEWLVGLAAAGLGVCSDVLQGPADRVDVGELVPVRPSVAKCGRLVAVGGAGVAGDFVGFAGCCGY